jgi:predicted dinucleotide-binding enzyme
MTTAIIGIGNIGGTVARDLTAGGEPVVLSACAIRCESRSAATCTRLAD